MSGRVGLMEGLLYEMFGVIAASSGVRLTVFNCHSFMASTLMLIDKMQLTVCLTLYPVAFTLLVGENSSSCISFN